MFHAFGGKSRRDSSQPMRRDDFDPTKLTQAHRVVGAIVGFAFAAIGVILIGWLWLQPFGFMHPPLMFRLLGSMVALIFVAVGGTAGMTAWKGGGALQDLMKRRLGRMTGSETPGDAPRTGYKCPNCGAALSDRADVSPSGDVKCDYCRTWFNIHG
jgi:hypothetical protein